MSSPAVNRVIVSIVKNAKTVSLADIDALEEEVTVNGDRIGDIYDIECIKNVDFKIAVRKAFNAGKRWGQRELTRVTDHITKE